MRRSKKRKISVFKILAFLLFVMSIFLIIITYKLDLFPIKYFTLMAAGLCVFDLLIISGLVKRKTKKVTKVFLSFFTIIVLGVMGFASYYILGTIGFFNSIKEVNYKKETYSVIVLKNSSYEKLKDVSGETLGYYSKSNGYKKTNKKIKNKVKVILKKYDDYIKIKDDLLNKKIKVIVLENSILSMIKEEDENFEKEIKTIYKFSVYIKSKIAKKDVNVTSKPFNIYISGIDTFGSISSVSRSDVNMVVTVNPKTKQILLTSIPRDYYVKLHGIGDTKDKLTHAGLYGVDTSIATIEDLLDIEINYYLKVNFTSVIDIVNALGGITVYSDYTFTSIDGKHYTQGNNSMNGEQALSFARERKAFAEGDRQRGKDQQAVIAAIINKVCSKNIITKYDSILKSVEGKFQTNMSAKKIRSLLKMQLNDMAKWNVSTYNLEGVDSSNYTYSGGNYKLYVMEPVLGSIEQASNLINSVIKGKKLKSTYEYDGPINTVSESSTENRIEKKEEVDNKNTVKYEYPKCKDSINGVCTIEKEETKDAICSTELTTDENGDQICSTELSCPDGYNLTDNKCIKKILEEVKVCEEGYTYQKLGMVCCPDGYSYNDTKKSCVQD